MKKIGFVDYFISEWHANNYPAWIERICADMGVDYKIAYAWAELDVSPVDGVSTAQWCEKFGAEGITVHPRPDERHIRYADVREIRPLIQTEFNIEGNPINWDKDCFYVDPNME